MQTTYRAGQWYVLVAPGALIALSPDAPDDLIAALWERQQTGGDLAAVIDALTEQASGSFAAMLPFAAVVLEGPHARIAVRGDVTVELTGREGNESFTGTNVTTWSERFARNTNRIAIDAGGAGDSASLPITGGIVRAANVSADVEPWDTVVPDADEADAADEDAAAPTDVAEADPAEPEDVPEENAPAEDASIDGASNDDASSGDEPADDAEDAAADSVIVPPIVPPVPPAPPAPPVAEATIASAEDAPVEDEPAREASTEAATAQIPEVAAGEPDPSGGEGEADEEEVDDSVEVATLMPAEISETSDIDEFEQLFGATIASPNAFVRPAPAPPAPPSAASLFAGEGDHDGATISAAEARALRQSPPTAEPDAPTAVIPVTPAAAGRVRVSTGQVVTLDRTVIIGRRPRSTRASGADLPHLIAVESPQQDISRSHLEIRPEGDTVVVVDLHTTNGSTLLRPGADPLRLHPGEQTLVLSGDVVDLGDGVTVAFEDLP